MADHKQGQDFTGLGPTGAGFRTNGARITTGVDAAGVVTGVKARGGTDIAGGIGVDAFAVGRGVAVRGVSVTGTGIEGSCRADDGIGNVGVRGSSAGSEGIGVIGSGTAVGVRGSGHRGAEFEGQPDGAAINLAPVGPAGVGDSPPKTGRPGDLYVMRALPTDEESRKFPPAEDRYLAQLWFCVRGEDARGPAVWGRIMFSKLR